MNVHSENYPSPFKYSIPRSRGELSGALAIEADAALTVMVNERHPGYGQAGHTIVKVTDEDYVFMLFYADER